jgi:Peptidase A4 family
MGYDDLSAVSSSVSTVRRSVPGRALVAGAVLTVALCAAADLVALPAAPEYPSSGYPASGYPAPGYPAAGYPAPGLAPAGLAAAAVTGLRSAPRAAARYADQTSSNWAGYAATGDVYTSVAASWIEPSVDCSAAGVVAFWVGLDGWGSQTVEQDGTGVDCTGGSPVHFAWWETYPGNAITQYANPVAAGDRLSSSVTSEPGGEYAMVLTDATRNWTETTQARVPGARNASAEVVTEAVSTNNTVSPLPDFHAADFSGARIDGAAPQAAAAQPIEMTDALGDQLAQTGPMDANGDFPVDYVGPSLPVIPPLTSPRHGLK